MKNTDQALGRILNLLADKFGTTVNHLYGILIKQAYIEGVECIIWLVIMAILAVIIYPYFWKQYKSFEKGNSILADDFWEDNFWLCAGVLTFTFAFILSIVLCGRTAIDCFYNPEYYALHNLIN